MPLRLAAFAAVALAAAASQAQAADAGVEVRHAAARMVVIPEARANVSVTIQGGDARLPRPVVRTEGRRVIVEGGLERRIGGCGGFGVVFSSGPHRDKTMRVMVRGIGPLTLDRLPVITVRVPMNASVAVGDAVWGEAGAADRMDFANAGCGNWTLGDVRERLSIAQSGSGDVRAGSAGSARLALSGSGDVTLDGVGSLDAAVSGSGDVRVASVEGPLSAGIVGSGDITVQGGRASSVAASVAGSGDFTFRGQAGSVAARIAGSGDITVAHASGAVSKAVAGSGDISIGR